MLQFNGAPHILIGRFSSFPFCSGLMLAHAGEGA